MSAGTITLASNSAVVTGSDTAFDSAFSAGDMLVTTVGGVTYTLPVKSVDSATRATLVRAYDGPAGQGLAWSAVPRDTLATITAQIASDVAYAMRSRINELNNWYQLLEVNGDVVIKLADGSTFTGPSWLKIASLANTSDLSKIQPIADRIHADSQQVASDKQSAATSAAAASQSAGSAAASKAAAAQSESSAATSATQATGSATAAAQSKSGAESARDAAQNIANSLTNAMYIGDQIQSVDTATHTVTWKGPQAVPAPTADTHAVNRGALGLLWSLKDRLFSVGSTSTMLTGDVGIEDDLSADPAAIHESQSFIITHRIASVLKGWVGFRLFRNTSGTDVNARDTRLEFAVRDETLNKNAYMYLRSADNALLNNGPVAMRLMLESSDTSNKTIVGPTAQIFTGTTAQGSFAMEFNKDIASGGAVGNLRLNINSTQRAVNINTGAKIPEVHWGFWDTGELQFNTNASGAWPLNFIPACTFLSGGNYYNYLCKNMINDNAHTRQLAVFQSNNDLCHQIVVESHQGNQGTAVFSFYQNGHHYGPLGEFLTSGSDWNLKADVTEITDTATALARINALGLYEYEWKIDGRKDRGVLAQDAGLVDDRYTYYTRTGLQEDGTFANEVLSVSHNALIGDLIGAVQALSADNDALRKRLDTLEAKGV